MKISFLSIPILFSLFGCETNNNTEVIHPLDQVQKVEESDNKETITLYDLNWMQGVWIDSLSFPGNVVIENWQLKQDTLIGERGTIKGLDTTYSQVSNIFIRNDEPVYTLAPEGSAFVSFKVKEFSKNSISFSNIANLAPTELTYTRIGKDLSLEFTIVTQVGERKFKHLFKN